jgi:hemin uptake protein HemP
MQLFDPNNPNERKKIIAAGALFVVAMAVLGYVFFGGSSKKPATNQNLAVAPRPVGSPKPTPAVTPDDSAFLQPIPATWSVPGVADPSRNIFAFYEPTPRPTIEVRIPTPTPAPTPPMAISSLSPPTVYARTADFSLEITGDKFTPASHVTVDGRDLPTRFISSQQLFITVPAALISTPGARQVMARTNDGKLYSNSIMLNVTPPPLPNYNFIGIIAKPRGNDTAVLQKKGDKELLNVYRGDVLEGRFRINSISEREVVLVDTTLKIRHTIPFTADNSNNPSYRPPTPPIRVTSDEP